MRIMLFSMAALALLSAVTAMSGNAAAGDGGYCYGQTIDDGYNYSCEGLYVSSNGLMCPIYYFNGHCYDQV